MEDRSPNRILLRQRGRIRRGASASWIHLEAGEHYATDRPGFVWKAWLPKRTLPIVVGRDEYFDGKGSIQMKALSLYLIASEEGDQMNDASLMRYLNEMTWFPAAFLGANVRWAPIDDDSAQVTIADRGKTATATMFFDKAGKPVKFRALRYYTDGKRMEMWETPFSAYRVFEGMNVPVEGQAVWRLGDGDDLAYIELEVTGVSHDRPVE